jgi:hypothetical protein
MHINYQVWTKAAPHPPWRFTGIVESTKNDKLWADIIRRLRYHAYELRWCTYGVAIDRS